MGRLRLREYAETDKPEVVGLLQRGLTKDFSVQRWDWLYHDRITILGSNVIVAEYDGKIVGAMGEIHKTFTFNDERFVGARHVDPVVDKSMRGKGVFTKMLYALNEISSGVDFIYTFPNDISYPGFAKTGYTAIGPIFMPQCQLGFLGVLSKEKIRFFGTGLKLIGRNTNKVSLGSIEDLKGLTPQSPRDKYALLRDYSYLNWRYRQSPVKNYELLVSKRDGSVQNACILSRAERAISIMDFVQYGDDIGLSDYLLAIKKIYGKVPVIIWDSNIDGVQRFFVGKSKQHFLVREKKSKMPKNFFDKDFWYITKGEVEGN